MMLTDIQRAHLENVYNNGGRCRGLLKCNGLLRCIDCPIKPLLGDSSCLKTLACSIASKLLKEEGGVCVSIW
jgi:hypothetical protein